MKLFLTPCTKHITDNSRAVFACSIAIAVNHVEVVNGHLEANFGHFFGCHLGGAMDVNEWANQAVRAMLIRVMAVIAWERANVRRG